MNIDDLSEAWRVNNVLNLELLDVVRDEDFELKPGKGKTIRSNFVHIIGVRHMWLEEKMAKEAAAIGKLDWKSATRDQILPAMQASSELMAELFRRIDAKPGRANPVRFFAYCVAHEANHRSQIEIALRINGREPGETFLYGLWEWGKK